MKPIHNEETMLIEGIEYSVGTNDGKVFNRIVFKGLKNFGGKNMMCFETENKAQITINPSYNSFTIEEIGQFPSPEDLNKGEQ
jgi:hypothetical protein